MKKCAFLLSILMGLILFACGGGGGGGGGGGDDGGGTTTYYAPDYLINDTSKVYTYRQTIVDTTGGKSDQTISTAVYTFSQVDSIPAAYGYPGTIAGPYTKQTLTVDGGVNYIFYLDSSGNAIINDYVSSSVFTRIDKTETEGSIPLNLEANTNYTTISSQELFNYSVTKIGDISSSYTIRAIEVVNLTVPAGNFETLHTQESSTNTTTTSTGVETVESTWDTWYGKDVGIVKKVITTTDTLVIGSTTETITSTETDELVTLTN
jgi:hypothetical protein